jgi:hypothetical protein
MHLRTLLVLILGVALLAALALWQLREEDEQRAKVDAPLVESFDRGRVTALRVDNLERSLQMRIERDSAGRWTIVDPLEFPAEGAVIDALMSALETQRLKPPLVTEREKLKLAPPRAVLEITEDVGGSARLTRLEIGVVDIGEQLIYVVRDGVLGRTERALDTLLERDLPDWRSHSLMSFDPRTVVELSRQGKLLLEGEAPLDLALEASLDGEWRSTAPFVAQLDPRLVGTLVATVASLRVEGFLDSPGPLEFYGLAEPLLRIEVVDARGASQALRMNPEPQGEMWYAKREDQPHIYRVSSLMASLCLPPTEGLVDRSFARVARGDVQRLELGYEGRSVTLARAERAWRVSGREGETVLLDNAIADDALVADALSAIEQARVEDLYFDRTLDASEVRGFVRLDLGGAKLGGVLGPPAQTSDGVEGVLFRRDGDQLVGLLPKSVLDLVRRDASSFQSLLLHKALELDVSYIEVKRGDSKRKWVRDEHGHWTREGMESEAKDFARIVDRLLSMRASAMLRRGEESVEGALDVDIVKYSGERVPFTLGLSNVAGAQANVYRSGELFATVGAEPYASLLKLLEGE